MNILVTGVGAIIGYGIIESLRLHDEAITIIATDIFEENHGKYTSDFFYQVPYTSDPNYENVITKIISDHKIDLVFPGIEQDLYYFAQHHSKFNTKFILNNLQLIELSKNKLKMYDYLEKNQFQDLIPTHTNLDFASAKELLGVPFIIKPKSSYASKGFHIIRSEVDLESVSSEINEGTLFQPMVGSVDEEYTIAVFGDGKGNFLDSIILRRYLAASGASDKTFVIKNDDALMKSVKVLVELFKPIGPTNFQFRKEGEKVFLLEINPRISSSCSIRTKFGYNEPVHCINYFSKNLELIIFPKKEGKAIRYIADNVIYE